MTLDIRPAAAADLTDLSALLVAQMRDHDNALDDATLAAAAAGVLERPGRGLLLIARADAQAVGFAALSYLWTLERGGRAAWLDELFVEPARRGQGIGAALLRAAIDAAAAAGAAALDLEIERGHERAAPLYARHGFAPLPRQHWALTSLPAPPAPPPSAVPLPLSGGCACGAVRYELSALPASVEHCHCGLCQRASGAPLVTWATVPAAAFRLARGTPRERRSSARARRTFCADCGSALTFQYDAEPQTLDVTVATLDTPDAVPPTMHIFTASQRAWLAIDDDLPRHRGRAR